MKIFNSFRVSSEINFLNMSIKRKSRVWTYFEKDKNQRLAVCKLYDLKIFRGNTGKHASDTSNHLKNKHSEEFLLVQTSLPKEQASANICASKSNVKQLNLYDCIQEKPEIKRHGSVSRQVHA